MRRVFTSSLLLVALIAGTVPAAHARQIMVRRVADGVIYRVYKENKPKLRIRTVTVVRKRVDDIRTVLGSGQLPGWERTSSISRRYGAVVAINGDYGRPSGRPVMAFAHGGSLKQTPLIWGRNFAVAPATRSSTIGHPHPQVWVEVAGERKKISRLNNGGPYGGGLAMFDRAGGWLERPPKRSCSARLVPTGIPRTDAGRSGLVIRHRVQRVVCSKKRLFPMKGRVISAKWRTGGSAFIGSLTEGSEVTMGWTLGWGPVREAIGGNPTLVEAGRVVVGRSNDPFFGKHPRTGVGITGKGKVIFVTVDGRQRRSKGMTLRGFALLFRRLGARWALNLDGGGSTTMVVRGRVMNRPSDGRERAVSSAIVVLPNRTRDVRDVKNGDLPERQRSWLRVATDPGSTGGLADSLEGSGVQLPGELERAAAMLRSDRRRS